MVGAMQTATDIPDELSERKHRRQESECKEIWRILDQVRDPEIPVISIRDLGILKDVRLEEDTVVVVITPTYSGCPAMMEIEKEIHNTLARHTDYNVHVRTELAPAWSTEHMTEAGKQALKEYGIAPPKSIHDTDHRVSCPHCGSPSTHLVSQFGSTACKALYQCDECREPFDHFKCL